MKKMIHWVIAATLICGASVFSACFTKEKPKVSATDDTSQFVTLTDAVPDAILEIRYFGTYNFVGTRIDGYLEPTALLTKQAAEALRAVSDDVKSQGYRLKIYDA
jgi:D-alanyl-D-alanine dipeptidase